MSAVKTTLDYERAFLQQMLGVSALVNDTLADLRYKFYKGVVEGTIVIGGGGGGGAAIFPGLTLPAAGNWFGALSMDTAGGNVGPLDTAALQQATLFSIPLNINIDQIGIQVTTLAAGQFAKVVFYTTGADGLIDGQLFVSGPISLAATGNATVAITQAIPAGDYCAFVIMDTVASVARLGAYPQRIGISVASSFNQIQNAAIGVPKYNINNYATPPNIPAATVGNQPAGNVPVIGLRRA